MKKKNLIIYMLFIMVVILIPSRVNAALNCLNDDKACVVCTYEYKDEINDKIIFRFKAWEENGNVKYESEITGDSKITGMYGQTSNPSFSSAPDSIDLSSNDFISQDKKRLSCKSLYFATLADYKFKVANYQKDGYKLLQLTGENNNHKELTTSSNSNKEKDNNTSMDFGDKLNDEDCQAVLGNTLEIINTVFNWIKIIAPILLIVFGSLDFGSAVLQDNQDALKKATSKFIKRAIAAVAIFFLPFIINLLLSLPGVNSGLENALCGISKVVVK